MPNDAGVPRARIAEEILEQVLARGPGKSICPSEVARALAEDWRPLLPAVRAEAARLSDEGKVSILRKGRPIPPAEMRGVIRLSLPRG